MIPVEAILFTGAKPLAPGAPHMGPKIWQQEKGGSINCSQNQAKVRSVQQIAHVE